MHASTTVAVLFYLLAVILAAVAAFVPVARGILACLAVAALSLGLAIQAGLP